jgi:hypothetical protein
MLDALGERYGKLPSELLESASTFDLQIYDIAVSYRNWLEKKATTKDPNELYDPNDLDKMMKQFKESRANG